MKEPQNSWEVSYVISIRKPHIKLDVSRNDLFLKIGRDRANQLQGWAYAYFDHRWFLEHI